MSLVTKYWTDFKAIPRRYKIFYSLILFLAIGITLLIVTLFHHNNSPSEDYKAILKQQDEIIKTNQERVAKDSLLLIKQDTLISQLLKSVKKHQEIADNYMMLAQQNKPYYKKIDKLYAEVPDYINHLSKDSLRREFSNYK